MGPIDLYFKDSPDPEGIRKAYILGYRTGYEDGKQNNPDSSRMDLDAESIQNIPIEAMHISFHAKSSLELSGCRYVTDVAKLSNHQIRRLKGVGKVTAEEIARALKEFGIQNTEWDYVWMNY